VRSFLLVDGKWLFRICVSKIAWHFSSIGFCTIATSALEVEEVYDKNTGLHLS
jgi:hypothetical protein